MRPPLGEFPIPKPSFQWGRAEVVIFFIQTDGIFSCMTGSSLEIYMDLCWWNVQHLRQILDIHHLGWSNYESSSPAGCWPIEGRTSTMVYPFNPVMTLKENICHPRCYGDDELWWIIGLMLRRFKLSTVCIPMGLDQFPKMIHQCLLLKCAFFVDCLQDHPTE